MIKIEFTRSRSVNFNEILTFAKSFSSFKEVNNIYSITFSPDEVFQSWERVSKLYQAVCKWSGCKIYLNGSEVKPNKMLLYYSLQALVLCSKHQSQHKCKLPNGLIGWGCSNIRRISRHLDNYVSCYWYDFGRFSPDLSTWIIDKDLLFDSLMSQASEMHLDLCPYFDRNTVRRIVDSLPDTIQIDGVNWQIKYRKDFVGSQIMNIPSGIQHIVQDEIEEMFPDQEKTVDEMTEDEINRLIEEKRNKNI